MTVGHGFYKPKQSLGTNQAHQEMGAYGCWLFFERRGVPLLPSIAPKFRGLESGKTITDAQRPIVPAKSPIRKYSRYIYASIPFATADRHSLLFCTLQYQYVQL